MNTLEDTVCALAVEYWLLARSFARQAERLPADVQHRASAQSRYAANRLIQLLGDADMTLATFEGRAFDASLPVVAVNADDFTGSSDLIIAEMTAPALLRDGQVLRMGQAILAKGEDQCI